MLEKDRVTEFQLDDDTLSILRRDLGVLHDTLKKPSNKCDGNRDVKIKGSESTSIKSSPSILSDGSETDQTESLDKSTEDTRSTDRLMMLYDLLIDPIKQFLPSESTENPSRLIFIPYGIIFSLPFAALRKDNDYLVEHYILSQIPALTILLQKLRNSQHHSTETLIAGNPIMPNEMVDPLPGAKEESRAFHKILGGKLLLKEGATKEAVQALLPTSSVIHLATHATHATLADSIAEQLQLEETTDAEIEGDYSIKGAIVLSKSSPTCSGILTSSEILSISLRCELMILSCCRTGCGKVTGSRAVLVAAANCLIATLWAIEDDSTSKFMHTFYSHYKDTRNASEALRTAILILLREGHAVSHWAAFCVSGVSPGMVHSIKSKP